MVRCDQCRRTKNISHRNEMAQQPILEIELFNVWGINFMGFLYLVAIDYVSKRVEAICEE